MPKSTQKKSSVEDLKQLMLQQQEVLDNILHHQDKMTRRLNLMTFFNILRSLIFIIPIILFLIYLPPIIRDLLQSYHELLSLDTSELIEFFLNNVSEEQLGEILKGSGN